jgi:antitoxin MazE
MGGVFVLIPSPPFGDESIIASDEGQVSDNSPESTARSRGLRQRNGGAFVEQPDKSLSVDKTSIMMYIQCIYTERFMITKIQKWGNSLGLRIPKAYAEETGVEAGSEVDLSVEDGELIIRPVIVRKLDLQHLLRGVNAENIHNEVETGKPVGREAW